MASYLGEDAATPAWTVKLAEIMYAETSDPVLKSSLGVQGWNIDAIKKLLASTLFKYPSETEAVAAMVKRAGVSPESAKSFLKNYKKVLADVAGDKEDQKLLKSLYSPTGTETSMQKKPSTIIPIVAGVAGLAAVLLIMKK